MTASDFFSAVTKHRLFEAGGEFPVGKYCDRRSGANFSGVSRMERGNGSVRRADRETAENGESGRRRERSDAGPLRCLQAGISGQGGYSYKSEMTGSFPAWPLERRATGKRSPPSRGGADQSGPGVPSFEKAGYAVLDEPTNHLDIGTLKWLEQYLKATRGLFCWFPMTGIFWIRL